MHRLIVFVINLNGNLFINLIDHVADATIYLLEDVTLNFGTRITA